MRYFFGNNQMPDQNNPFDNQNPAPDDSGVVSNPEKPEETDNKPLSFPEDINIPPISPDMVKDSPTFAPSQTISDSAPLPNPDGSTGVPPMVPGLTPKKKFGGKKIVATILGILVLLGSLGAGIILVKQQQDIREKAGGCCQKDSDCSSYVCIMNNFCGVGSGQCGNCTANSCPKGTECKGGYCQDKPSCLGLDQVCGAPTDVCCQGLTCTIIDSFSGASACKPATTCTSAGQCLPSGGTCCTGLETISVSESSCASRRRCSTPVATPTGQPPPPPPGGGKCSDASAANCQGKNPGDICRKTFKCKALPNQIGPDNKVKCFCDDSEATPTATPSPTPGPAPRCWNIKAYDTSWNQLSASQLSGLKAGDRVRFAVSGSPANKIDKAKFKINGVDRPETSSKKPSTDEYYNEYTIPAGTTSFTINAKLHHVTLGWF